MSAAARLGVLLSAAALLLSCNAWPQKFEPQVGQGGKDVIWVPTPDDVVERMLAMAQVKPGELVVDLGAGDGKIAIAAAKSFGARALGIEYNPKMVKYANESARKAGVAGDGPGKALIRQGDIFATDFSQADVVTLYLLPALNMRLRPQLLALRPGTRIVSHSFGMEDWEPDETSLLDGRRAYFWIVPASVHGVWTLQAGSQALELDLEQHFQAIEGTVTFGELRAGLREPRLRGAQIAFGYVDPQGVRRDFSGRVDGRRMQGEFRDDRGGEGKWQAVKR